MPSELPRVSVVMPKDMRDWIEQQRQPCESAAQVIRRVLYRAMQADRS